MRKHKILQDIELSNYTLLIKKTPQNFSTNPSRCKQTSNMLSRNLLTTVICSRLRFIKNKFMFNVLQFLKKLQLKQKFGGQNFNLAHLTNPTFYHLLKLVQQLGMQLKFKDKVDSHNKFNEPLLVKIVKLFEMQVR